MNYSGEDLYHVFLEISSLELDIPNTYLFVEEEGELFLTVEKNIVETEEQITPDRVVEKEKVLSLTFEEDTYHVETGSEFYSLSIPEHSTTQLQDEYGNNLRASYYVSEERLEEWREEAIEQLSE